MPIRCNFPLVDPPESNCDFAQLRLLNSDLSPSLWQGDHLDEVLYNNVVAQLIEVFGATLMADKDNAVSSSWDDEEMEKNEESRANRAEALANTLSVLDRDSEQRSQIVMVTEASLKVEPTPGNPG